MKNKGNLVPKKIRDKNGKATTVWVDPKDKSAKPSIVTKRLANNTQYSELINAMKSGDRGGVIDYFKKLQKQPLETNMAAMRHIGDLMDVPNIGKNDDRLTIEFKVRSFILGKMPVKRNA